MVTLQKIGRYTNLETLEITGLSQMKNQLYQSMELRL